MNYNEKEILKHLQQRLSPKRYHHSLCVADRAAGLARRYGEDESRARFCGLTHDICKNLPEPEQLRLIEESGVVLEREVTASPQLWHAIAGSCYLRHVYNISDPEILNAVRYHTTGRAEMSLLEEIIYLADLTSSDRDYPDVEYTRSLTDRSLRAGMLHSLKFILSSLVSEGRPICRESFEAYNNYCQAPLEGGGRSISHKGEAGTLEK